MDFQEQSRVTENHQVICNKLGSVISQKERHWDFQAAALCKGQFNLFVGVWGHVSIPVFIDICTRHL